MRSVPTRAIGCCNAMSKEKYINLFTDFGFKKIFGEETGKAHLISFLNTLLPKKHQIRDLQFCRNEYQDAAALDRQAILDLNCQSTTGEFFCGGPKFLDH